MKLNIKKLSQEINTISNQIKFLRANNRVSLYDFEYRKISEEFGKMRDRPLESQLKFKEALDRYWDFSINGLRRKVTLLCSIRAANRGKLHQQKIRNPSQNLPGQPKFKFLTLEDQQTLIAQHVSSYEKAIM